MLVRTTPLVLFFSLYFYFYLYYNFRLFQLSGLQVSSYSTVVPTSGTGFGMAYIQKEQNRNTYIQKERKITAAMRRRLEMAVNMMKWFR